MKPKDIFLIFLSLLLIAFLAYIAFTVSHWWEWVFVAIIVILFGAQTRSYLLRR